MPKAVTFFGDYVAAQMETAMSQDFDTEILIGRTPVRHRLTIHRHNDPDLTMEFDTLSTGDWGPDAVAIKAGLTYDIDHPVFTFIVVEPDGKIHGLSLPTHQIDHITFEPIENDKPPG